MELLILLVERRGELVTREQIGERLWGKGVFLDLDHGINTAVRKVRRALRDDPEKPAFVQTVVGKGYRFAAAVHCTGQAAAAAAPAPAPQAPMAAAGGRLFPRRKAVLLGLLALSVGAASWMIVRRASHAVPAPAPAIHSLAVLPLANLSGDSSQDYLAGGMTEALIGRLAGIHNLRVISRTSVMRFQHTRESAPEIARALHVDALVEGSVVRQGSRIRVTAQLIRGASDTHIWAATYDRDFGDVLGLESDIAQAIASRVEVTISGNEMERLAAPRPVSPAVYENYLKGRFALENKGATRAGIEEAIADFQSAVRQDPAFAPAYLGLANAYDRSGTIFIGAPPGAARRRVIETVQKALQLDPGLAEGHLLLADMEQRQWHWSKAEAEYRRALELNPNGAAARAGFAQWLACQGRLQESENWAESARQLDPEGVSGSLPAWILFFARRYDDAGREVRSQLAVHPNDADALWIQGFILLEDHQPRAAIRPLEKAAAASGRSPGVLGVLAGAYAQAGRRGEALKIIDELQRRRRKSYVPAGAFVNAYLGIGDYDQAFVWLDRAYEEQSNLLQFVKVHPVFDPVRRDPRFAELVRRIGLE